MAAAGTGGDNPLNKHLVEPLADFSKKGVQFLEKVRERRGGRRGAPACAAPALALPGVDCAALPARGTTPKCRPPCAVPQAQDCWYVACIAVAWCSPDGRRRCRRTSHLTLTPAACPISAELQRMVTELGVGFLALGVLGFFVKLIHIPINNILVGA